LLTYEIGRWSKYRSFIKSSSYSLSQKSDDEIRCYTNYFILFLADVLSEERSLQDSMLDMIEVRDDNYKIEISDHDFADNINKFVMKWARRLNLLKTLTLLVRQYKRLRRNSEQSI
jgi:hypothetical protein